MAACAGTSAVLVLARLLTPDPSGAGTHVQLGLPACGFLSLTSLPCPACGLTTAFTHTARLQLTAAMHAHVLGAPLYAVTAVGCAVSVLGCVRAWPITDTMKRLRVSRLAVIICVAAMLAWIVRVASMIMA